MEKNLFEKAKNLNILISQTRYQEEEEENPLEEAEGPQFDTIDQEIVHGLAQQIVNQGKAFRNPKRSLGMDISRDQDNSIQEVFPTNLNNYSK